MQNSNFDTIYASLTTITNSTIAVIRISGKDSLNLLDKLCVSAVNKIEPKQIYLKKIYEITEEGEKELLDEILLSYYKSPNSFTGEDVLELNIHSSPVILKKLFKIMAGIPNFRHAEAGEFSKRAFLNDKMDLIQAEAINDLIKSETELQHKQALNQLSGKMSNIYQKWRSSLIEIMAYLEGYIDFPDEDLPDNLIKEINNKILILKNDIEKYLNNAKKGKQLRDGIKIAIIGDANVGKSSLINHISGRDIAIVSDIAGTTRDIIEAHLNLSGIPVIISDSAGIRNTDDQIEEIGIDKAIKRAKDADIKLLLLSPDVIDYKKGNIDIEKINQHIIDIIRQDTGDVIIAVNKCDLIQNDGLIDSNKIIKLFDHDLLFISVKYDYNIDKLIDKITDLTKNQIGLVTNILITRERHHTELAKAFSYLSEFNLEKELVLAAEDLRLTSNHIGKIIGIIGVEDILDIIFSSFCIGK